MTEYSTFINTLFFMGEKFKTYKIEIDPGPSTIFILLYKQSVQNESVLIFKPGWVSRNKFTINKETKK